MRRALGIFFFVLLAIYLLPVAGVHAETYEPLPEGCTGVVCWWTPTQEEQEQINAEEENPEDYPSETADSFPVSEVGSPARSNSGDTSHAAQSRVGAPSPPVVVQVNVQVTTQTKTSHDPPVGTPQCHRGIHRQRRYVVRASPCSRLHPTRHRRHGHK